MSDRNGPDWEEKLEQKFKDLEAEINNKINPSSVNKILGSK